MLALILVSVLLPGMLLPDAVPVSKAMEKTIASAAEKTATSATEKTETDYGIYNPRTDSEGVTTWDCIYFGNYWQSDTNNDRKADKNDTKEPIKWRVLSVNGDDAFLLADQNLDRQKYWDWPEEYLNAKEPPLTGDFTWKWCTVRSWLNGYGADYNMFKKDYSSDNFLDNAFSAGEQAAIQNANVVSDDNPEYMTEGGDDTTDKIYLLSIQEVQNSVYGFDRDRGDTNLASRWAKNTAYAESQGAYTYKPYFDDEKGFWVVPPTEYNGNGN